MEVTVSYFVMLQKYINSNKRTLKQKFMHCVQEMFEKVFQLIILKKTGLRGSLFIYLFLLVLILLIIATFYISTDI